jgi:hypothetical protein
MFSFHKPKIYRSVNGCCICKAKSSSSRFTDSKKYEPEFGLCFKILEKRSGEICNACVLLVKRWKKLPVGTGRDWHHVVDARAGPGTKSMMKYKSKSKINKRHSRKSHRSKRLKIDSPEGLSDDVTVCEDFLSDQSSFGASMPPSLAPSPTPSDASDDSMSATPVLKPRQYRKQKNPSSLKLSTFIDTNYWKKVEVCCGIIFVGPSGVAMLDDRLFKPCFCTKIKAKQQLQKQQARLESEENLLGESREQAMDVVLQTQESMNVVQLVH